MRDELTSALKAQPFDHEIVVAVSGTYVDVSRVRSDPDRDVIVIELLLDDLRDAVSRFFRSAPECRGGGNSL
jgi:hypothetical protein